MCDLVNIFVDLGMLTTFSYMLYTSRKVKKAKAKESKLRERGDILEEYRNNCWGWHIPKIARDIDVEGKFSDYPDLENRALTLCKVSNIKIHALESLHVDIQGERSKTTSDIREAYSIILDELNTRREKVHQYEDKITTDVVDKANKILNTLCERPSEWGDD